MLNSSHLWQNILDKLERLLSSMQDMSSWSGPNAEDKRIADAYHSSMRYLEQR